MRWAEADPASVVVITPPTTPAISYAECKAHLRIDHDDDQAYIEALAAAAEQHFAAPIGWLGRSIALQTLQISLAYFRDCIGVPLPYGPVRSVESVEYDDAISLGQTVDPAGYALVGAGSSVARLTPSVGGAWPDAMRGAAVRVNYIAGYEPSSVPAPLKHAMLLLVSHWYESREAAVTTAVQIAALPFAVDALASPYRIWTI